MSHTPTIGVYPLSYWALMANCLAKYAKWVYEHGRTDATQTQPGSLREGRGFFAPALEKVEWERETGAVPKNLVIAPHRLELVRRILRRCGQNNLVDEELETLLKRFLMLLAPERRTLGMNGKKAARLLQNFFSKLEQLGDSEDMGEEEPTLPPLLLVRRVFP